jgi:hypothetical protein
MPVLVTSDDIEQLHGVFAGVQTLLAAPIGAYFR